MTKPKVYKAIAYPRVGLIGNPSDGYFGRTIAFTFSDFGAEVLLAQTPKLKIVPDRLDVSEFTSIADLHHNVKTYGYYGGIRLLKATIKKFFECFRDEQELTEKNFTISYSSTIPHRVGLAGSSAIITACFRALMDFYDVEMPPEVLANRIREVETQELKIPAGLQDRVAQVYQGVVYMDFNHELMESRTYGEYQRLDLKTMPNFYIAYRPELSEGTEVSHNVLALKYQEGDEDAHAAMDFWADLTTQAKLALEEGDHELVTRLIDLNFDKREDLYGRLGIPISKGNLEMVRAARSIGGVSAKFSGSGGAIVGTYRDEETFNTLKTQLGNLNITVLKPTIVYEDPHG
ncbi:MAG: hypothetical protein AAF492_02400 [Verrucomicrobiota bacterium]